MGEPVQSIEEARRFREAAMCTTKVGYPSRTQAKKAVKRMKRRGVRGLHPYACPLCPQWHTGHAVGESTYIRSGGRTMQPEDTGWRFSG